MIVLYAARVATAALMAVLLAVALAGCGAIEEGRSAAEAGNERLREHNAGLVSACVEAGGAPRMRDWGASLYVGCDFPPCAGARFRPDYYPPPAEAPEGGTP